jgi:hypothetical protein
MLQALSALATSIFFILMAVPFLPFLGAVFIAARLSGNDRPFLVI